MVMVEFSFAASVKQDPVVNFGPTYKMLAPHSAKHHYKSFHVSTNKRRWRGRICSSAMSSTVKSFGDGVVSEPSRLSPSSYVARWGRYFERQEKKSSAATAGVRCYTPCSTHCSCFGSSAATSGRGKNSSHSKSNTANRLVILLLCPLDNLEFVAYNVSRCSAPNC